MCIKDAKENREKSRRLVIQKRGGLYVLFCSDSIIIVGRNKSDEWHKL